MSQMVRRRMRDFPTLKVHLILAYHCKPIITIGVLRFMKKNFGK